MVDKIFIRLTFKDGGTYYVGETRKNMYMSETIKDAFEYKNMLEFKVTFKFHNIAHKNSWEHGTYWDKGDVVKFESINSRTLESTEFDISEVEVDIKKGDTIYVDSFTFRKLMKCGITCSSWLSDKDDEWVAFPKEEDYDRITKIRYYERGLTHTMTSQDNYLDRYDTNSWHSCYDLHHQLMLHPLIQQISLLDLDCCDEFTFHEDKNLEKYEIRR